MTLRVLAPSLALVVAAGCASAPNGAEPAPAAAPEAAPASPHQRANTISKDDIRRTQLATLYDAVRSLRPRWLQKRGNDSFVRGMEIQVYVDGQRMAGGLASLREIRSLEVSKAEFVDPNRAAGRWGTGHGEGAIVVTLAAREAP